jgi:hypothetical protein
MIPYGVGFFGTNKVAVNAVDPFEPIQDFFTNIKSGYLEDSLG